MDSGFVVFLCMFCVRRSWKCSCPCYGGYCIVKVFRSHAIGKSVPCRVVGSPGSSRRQCQRRAQTCFCVKASKSARTDLSFGGSKSMARGRKGARTTCMCQLPVRNGSFDIRFFPEARTRSQQAILGAFWEHFQAKPDKHSARRSA